MITLMADNEKVDIKWLKFSDGAITCKVSPFILEAERYISIVVNPRTEVCSILEELRLVVNAIHNLDEVFLLNVDVNVMMNYLPYGRGDRIFEEGNPHPLDVFLEGLDDIFYLYKTKVFIADPHNKAALKVMERSCEFVVESQLNCLKYSVGGVEKGYDYIIAPDKGAKKKAKEIGEFYGIPVVEAEKERDISTGQITKVTLHTNGAKFPPDSRVLIVDDILDGGGTFIPLAKELCSQGCTVDLYVTHLIAAKGLDIFEECIQDIYCYHIVGNYVSYSDLAMYNMFT